MERTCLCGNVTKTDIGKEVCLMGWVSKSRDLGGVVFIDLRDRSGIMQIVFNENSDADTFKLAEGVGREDVIKINGIIRERDVSTINSNISTGEIEVLASAIEIFSKSKTPPFYIEEEIDTNENVRLKYRYLDLRRPDMQKKIILRHKTAKIIRDYLDENGFLEIETPMLTKSTPEGARDYLVPSRVHPGKFYALPQSPQVYKQLLMLSGMDRYFQVARCFRDEDLRADRQPEFTQIDIEMSFVNTDDVLTMNEGLVKKIFKSILDIDIPTPFLRLPYSEAMDRFGSDKPDTRFDLELIDLSGIAKDCGFKVFSDAVANKGSVRAINVKGGSDKFSRRDLDSLVDFVKIYRAKGLAWIIVNQDELKSPITKFLSEEETSALLDKCGAEIGDLLLFVADKNEIVFDALGALRCELAKRLNLIDNSKYNFLWVVDFPLLEYDATLNRYKAKHHPFTSPKKEDIPLLDSDPSQVRANAYDIVLNGMELGGGSIRIHDTSLQEKMFECLGFTKEEAWDRFGFLMEAFQYGTPPHGGIAYGLDRLAMLLTGSESIREVIAFPKVQTASEVMLNSPDGVEPKQLEELHIKVVKQ